MSPAPGRVYEENLERLRKRLRAWFGGQGLRPETADDAVQDTMMVLISRYAHVTVLDELLKLGITIARNVKFQALRGQGRYREIPEGHEEVDKQLNAEEDLARRGWVKQMMSLVPKLGDRCLKIIQLQMAKKSTPDIAAALGISENTLYAAVSRCRQKARDLMKGGA